MSRAVVRQVVQQWFDPTEGSAWSISGGVPDQLDKVWTSFPNEINYQLYERVEDVDTRAQGVVFIVRQTETRESIGGQHSGGKFITYNVVLQMFCVSILPDADEVMGDIDTLADALHARAVADHTFGQPSSVIFKAAEPDAPLSFGEPMKDENGMTQVWFQLGPFDVVQWYQA